MQGVVPVKSGEVAGGGSSFRCRAPSRPSCSPLALADNTLKMPLFYTGDELGSVKSVNYTRYPESKQWKPETKILVGDASAGRVKGIQKLALHADEDSAQ